MKRLVSVVVPTRDRASSLRACLDAISVQTARPLEVLVVDDGSTSPDEIAAVVSATPQARLLRADGRGPAAARNAGAREARGSILCFTDDDCVPQAEWAERLAAAIERGADAAAGTTLSAGGALADASELVAQAPARVRPPAGSDLAFAPSNNLACARAVWAAVPFDESYPAAAAEDREWCNRLARTGYVLRLEPDARIVHAQDLTLRSFLARQVRYGHGAYRFRRVTASRQLEPPGFYTAFLRDAFGHGARVGLLVSAAQVATLLGYAQGWAASRRRPGAVIDREAGSDA
jgi:glycosyltransferase involved in cell wall biosynthesis